MGDVRVINFHGIGEPQRTLDPGEAPYWISVDRFRYMLDQIVAHPDQKNIAITFDDGNLSDLIIGVTELSKRNLTAEFFVLTGRIGKTGSLDEHHIRAILSAGMHIGSHGIDHRDWSSLSAAELQNELTNSKSRLEELCGKAMNAAAIPFGRYNAAVIAASRKAGYSVLYSSDGGTMDPRTFLRARSTVRSDTSDSGFADMLDGRMPLAKRLRRAVSTRLKQLV